MWRRRMYKVVQQQQHAVVMLCCGGLTLAYCMLGLSVPVTEEEHSTSHSYQTKGNSCRVPPLHDADEFFALLETPQVVCKNLQLVGGGYYGWRDGGEGGKLACMDPGLTIGGEKCLVLSFGIGADWTFDDAMDDIGCKVYSMDPTLFLPDHNRTDNIQFLDLGVGKERGYQNITINKQVVKAKVDTYQGILHRLGILNSTIDYMKLDIEGAELDFLDDAITRWPHLLHNIKQIGIEIHTSKLKGKSKKSAWQKILKFWTYFHQLQCEKFQLVWSVANDVSSNLYQLNGQQRSGCYEILLINQRFLSGS
ncbi:unnamed protein product [Meganyctiphanes norvegica]|uniref:Methyltransferase domain-containing protein n=1 Tax=Meganyctiphanes norvegica TaxID=48144 RepID=A0AAV2PV53_MEGNR